MDESKRYVKPWCLHRVHLGSLQILIDQCTVPDRLRFALIQPISTNHKNLAIRRLLRSEFERYPHARELVMQKLAHGHIHQKDVLRVWLQVEDDPFTMFLEAFQFAFLVR